MPDDPAVPAQRDVPVPRPDPTLHELRKVRNLMILGFLIVLSAIGAARFYGTNTETVDEVRPECDHDPQFETIAGDYTPVPEYHDCQPLVVRDDYGSLVYGQMVALFLSKDVIEGRLTGTTFIPVGERLVAQPVIPLPRGIDIPGGINSPGFSSQFQSAGSSPLPVRVIGRDGTDLGAAEGLLVIPWVQAVADMDYDPLGIKKGFNCMYFQAAVTGRGIPVGLAAKMVFVGPTFVDCSLEQFKRRPGKILSVTATGTGLVPKAARWDWSANETHVIGVPCPNPKSVGLVIADVGAATSAQTWEPGDWCDVGDRGAEPHGANPDQKAIKGWSDEQYLADPSPGGPVRTDVIGTVFPVAGLSERKVADYDTGFANVAYVALRVRPNSTTATDALHKYAQRFGFHPVDPGLPFESMATIALCYGSKETCLPPDVTPPTCTTPSTASSKQTNPPVAHQWWARTQSSDKNVTKYHCVVYRGHDPAFDMPGVVRWRFHPNPGETNWIGCPEGCCELGG